MDWILIVIILLCLASLVLNIIQVSRNNSENFDNSIETVVENAEAEAAKAKARKIPETNVRDGNTDQNFYPKEQAAKKQPNAAGGVVPPAKAKASKKDFFADVKNGSYLNFFDSEVPFVPGQSWMNLQQCYLNY